MSTENPRGIEYLPLSELRKDPRNPKDHAEEEIAASLSRFGVVDLMVQDRRTGYLISGHGRAQALEKAERAGDEPPEGVQLREDGTWLVPVVTGWASRTDTEAHAAIIALNRTTELGGWDDERLLQQLEQLDEDGSGFAGVGFQMKDMKSLQRKLSRLSGELDRDPDEVDSRDEARASSGITEDGSRTNDDYRLLVANLPGAVFDWVQERLRETARRHGVSGNARAFLMLVGEYTGETVPEEYLKDAEDEA